MVVVVVVVVVEGDGGDGGGGPLLCLASNSAVVKLQPGLTYSDTNFPTSRRKPGKVLKN